MSEKPILFSAPMVRAILDDKKTQTRRTLNLDLFTMDVLDRRGIGDLKLGVGGYGGMSCYDANGGCTSFPLRCPYGAPGDRLWVRETHYLGQWTEEHFYNDVEGNSRSSVDWCWPQPGDTESVHYAADGDPPADRCERWTKRPSIYMPRWASRITLEVTSVRVERLQDITEEDARAEGVAFGEVQDAIINGERGRVAFFNARDAFAHLWNAINGKRAPWASNPWLWVVSFRRVETP